MRIKIFVIVSFLLISNLSHAQKGKKEKSTEYNTQGNIESVNKEKTDNIQKALQESPDGKIESFGDDKVISTEDYWLEDIKGRGARFDTSYIFNNKFHFQIEEVNKESFTTSDYLIFFNDTTPHLFTEMNITSKEGKKVKSNQISSIADGISKCCVILINLNDLMNLRLTDTIITEINLDVQSGNNAKEKLDNGTITKTGDSRIIAGYKCDEYIFKEDGSKNHGKLWLTNDLNLKNDKYSISKSNLSAYNGYSALEEGVIMTMETYDEKNDKTIKSEVKEINYNISHVVPSKEFFNPETATNIKNQLLRTYKCQSGMEITVELIRNSK